MCGICGIAMARGAAPPDQLAAMSATLVHRGPDSDGVFVDGSVGLAARRLAIEEASEPFRTFSIGFEERSFDELADARLEALAK